MRSMCPRSKKGFQPRIQHFYGDLNAAPFLDLVENDLHPVWLLELAKIYLDYFEDANSPTCSRNATEGLMEIIQDLEDEHTISDIETNFEKGTQTGQVRVEISPYSSIHISDDSYKEATSKGTKTPNSTSLLLELTDECRKDIRENEMDYKSNNPEGK
ncbi:hypothetical protein AVEN_272190-1 [Araneus ventricosus]|uniref:Uncharacterized protein n=1 Tax=Araneus ventricosus TaxID=182803 RepID=A0A4Y2HVR5_ARAVE|nr:hypothetical protein AVEN_272190-1 [Araneus ventricosus]